MKKFKLVVVAILLSSISLSSVYAENSNDTENKAVSEMASELKIENSQIVQGSQWSPEDNIIFQKNEKKEGLTWSDIKEDLIVKGKVNSQKIGKYKVVYQYKKLTKEIEVEVVKELKETVALKEIKIKDIVLYQGEDYQVSESFDEGITKENKKVTWQEVAKGVKVENPVDTNKIGTYQVTYQSGETKAEAEVDVIPKPTKLVVKNISIDLGEAWKAEDSFDSVIMSDGSKLLWKDVAKDIVVADKKGNTNVSDLVNTKKAGEYTVVYTYEGVSVTATVTVKEAKVPDVTYIKSLELKNSKLTVGDSWEPSKNFVQVLMSNGEKLTWQKVSNEMIVKSEVGTGNQAVNTNKAGSYTVSYTYDNLTAYATVKVEEKVVPVTPSVRSIELLDTKLKLGDSWDASKNFVKIIMSDGSELSWQDVSDKIIVTNQLVNTQKAGVYEVNYEYGGKSAIAKVTVEETLEATVASIELRNLTVTAGSVWSPSDGFVKVTMSDGKELTWQEVSSEMVVTGSTGSKELGQIVNTGTLGTYEVTYEYKKVIAKATVTVVAVTKPTSNTTTTSSTTAAKKLLPQTGEKNSVMTIISGVVIVAGLLLLALRRIKRIED